MNAGTRLQKHWRWNRKPLRVRIRKIGPYWQIAWERYDFRRDTWNKCRAYTGCNGQPLLDVIHNYRECAWGWRGVDW